MTARIHRGPVTTEAVRPGCPTYALTHWENAHMDRMLGGVLTGLCLVMTAACAHTSPAPSAHNRASNTASATPSTAATSDAPSPSVTSTPTPPKTARHG